MDQIRVDPQDKLPPTPPPLGHVVNKTPTPTGQKSACAPPTDDNFWNSPYMKSGILDHENYPILEYGKRENMKLGTWNKVILKFELGNLHHPLGSPSLCVVARNLILLSFVQFKDNIMTMKYC